MIGNDEFYIDIKLRYDELLREVIVQGGMIGANDRLQTLLGALPEKIDLLREAYFTQTPGIQYLWDRMYDIESTERKRALQSGASGMAAEAEVYYVDAIATSTTLYSLLFELRLRLRTQLLLKCAKHIHIHIHIHISAQHMDEASFI